MPAGTNYFKKGAAAARMASRKTGEYAIMVSRYGEPRPRIQHSVTVPKVHSGLPIRAKAGFYFSPATSLAPGLVVARWNPFWVCRRLTLLIVRCSQEQLQLSATVVPKSSVARPATLHIAMLHGHNDMLHPAGIQHLGSCHPAQTTGLACSLPLGRRLHSLMMALPAQARPDPS